MRDNIIKPDRKTACVHSLPFYIAASALRLCDVGITAHAMRRVTHGVESDLVRALCMVAHDAV